ncbi:GntR family transcriptional regulator [Aquibaculum arenosum]|uniref:GntR family transcriptional regulator n=1 Tax=Aquibaculum arenosum TaxID=3032591 RepID=A0ABT5YMG3_9PROT|nr:GntR family transcriptional regulator [Fodinicurvata sp. CAU 1616]MDF2096125.1 GntR family transcriptional regulator [Fodinicurvata sp. CAU 1616]
MDDIQAIILQRIRLLEYPPGSRLHEAKLAEEFGASRTPVREALNRLHHLGLVQTRNGVGTVVVQLELKELAEIYQMRVELCALIGRLSPNEITEHHVREARDLLAQAQQASRSGVKSEYFRINERINALVKSVIGNSALRSTWDFLHSQASSAWHHVDTKEAFQTLADELEDMIVALEYGDPQAVGAVQGMHIRYGFLRLLRALESRS